MSKLLVQCLIEKPDYKVVYKINYQYFTCFVVLFNNIISAHQFLRLKIIQILFLGSKNNVLYFMSQHCIVYIGEQHQFFVAWHIQRYVKIFVARFLFKDRVWSIHVHFLFKTTSQEVVTDGSNNLTLPQNIAILRNKITGKYFVLFVSIQYPLLSWKGGGWWLLLLSWNYKVCGLLLCFPFLV